MNNYPFVRDPFTVIDGGLSTALELLGADISGPLWTAQTVIEDPALLERAHRSFVEAGANIIATASYQCGTKQFESIGLSAKEARDALASTTTIAHRAVEGTSVAVAASVGPFGASLANGSEYNGRYGVEWQVVEDYHREKLAILVDSGADLIAIETIPLADEALLIAEILEELGAPPAWFSFGFADETQTYGLDAVDKAVLSITGLGFLFSRSSKAKLLRYLLKPFISYLFNNAINVIIFQNTSDKDIFLNFSNFTNMTEVIPSSGIESANFKIKDLPSSNPAKKKVILVSRL